MADHEKLTGDQVAELGLDDWRPILGSLRARFTTGDFVTGVRLASAIAEAAEELNHHPDLDLRYPHLDVRLTSHDVGGKTTRDVELARRVSAIAGDLGIGSEPAVVQELELGLDTWDADEIRPFWAAVLAVEDRGDELVDSSGVLPTIWFQETDRHDEPRMRFHLDITVPPEAAQARIEAAVAAGGAVVSRDFEPSFTVLADAQGNKVCVCTHLARSS